MKLTTLTVTLLALYHRPRGYLGSRRGRTKPTHHQATATLNPRANPTPTGWSQENISIMVGSVERRVLADGPGSGTYTCEPVPYSIIVSYHGRGATPERTREPSHFHHRKYCSVVLYPEGLMGLGRDSTETNFGTLKSCWQDAPYCTPKVPGTATAPNSQITSPATTVIGSPLSPVSGPFYYATASLDVEPTCSPNHPIPVINFHGDVDRAVKYAGSGRWESCLGPLCDPPGRVARIPNLPKWAAAWGALNSCTSQDLDVPVPGAVQPSSGQETFLSRYYGCGGGVEVLHYHTKNGLHDWPSLSPNKDNAQDDVTFLTVPAVLGTMDATEEIVKFFKRFTLVP
ncbi:hypothetical protein L873DRAFT_1843769 [Choiromyces venosus 120613-1]|uniref:Feruloyl esterase n=1 Tax=Choiromyces venosus 120613-1 TaxID=1336337 RepID=A0A3N4JM41_9PEZI|nr:hypothetical protein L873DRAFT_1843769 [Choiromyces venosus 120613-1]